MRSEATKALDRVDGLAPGSGSLDFFGYASGSLDAGSIGLGMNYEHKMNSQWGAFARATAGYEYGDRNELGYEALIGLRGRW